MFFFNASTPPTGIAQIFLCFFFTNAKPSSHVVVSFWFNVPAVELGVLRRRARRRRDQPPVTQVLWSARPKATMHRRKAHCVFEYECGARAREKVQVKRRGALVTQASTGVVVPSHCPFRRDQCSPEGVVRGSAHWQALQIVGPDHKQ